MFLKVTSNTNTQHTVKINLYGLLKIQLFVKFFFKSKGRCGFSSSNELYNHLIVFFHPVCKTSAKTTPTNCVIYLYATTSTLFSSNFYFYIFLLFKKWKSVWLNCCTRTFAVFQSHSLIKRFIELEKYGKVSYDLFVFFISFLFIYWTNL